MLKIGLSIFLFLGYLFSIAQSDSTVYPFAETPPQFPGGSKGLMKFINKHLVYPEQERIEEKTATVPVQFIINEDGTVTDGKVLNSAGKAFDNEALRLVKMLRDFKPGYNKGKAVKVYYSLSIVFDETNMERRKVETAFGQPAEYQLMYAIDRDMENLVNDTDTAEYRKVKNYILQHITYPEKEAKYGMSGTVNLRFWVNENHTVRSAKIARKDSEGFNKAVQRVLTDWPGYNTAYTDGKSSRLYFDMPVKFTVDSNGVKKIIVE